jgi:DNA-binding NarL/FixJ family response regulator
MKVGIISPSPLIRAALIALVRQSGDCKDAFDISTLDDFRGSGQPYPDVWVAHVLHAHELSETTRRLRAVSPTVPSLALLKDSQFEIEAIKAGFRGLISWDFSPNTVFKALRAVARGEVWITDKAAKAYIAHHLIPRSSQPHGQLRISEREAEILAIAATGRRSAEIANQLHISVATVRSHLRSIYRKLGVDNRVSAAFAFLHDLQGQTQGQTQTGVRLGRAGDTPHSATASEPAQTRSSGGNKQRVAP